MSTDSILVADIGGTNARFGMLEGKGDISKRLDLENDRYSTLADAVRDYIDRTGTRPSAAGLAVASPVVDDWVELTNRDWSFSIEAMRETLGLERLEVLNDFAALALALPHLGEDDVRELKPGRAVAGAPLGLIGPGTGLGVAALIPTPAGAVPLATEAGHQDLAATNEREWAIRRWLSARHGNVSTERVLSGPGLSNLHAAIVALDGLEVDSPLRPRDVAAGARDGRAECLEALALFTGWLGATAGDLALSLGALGGIYLAGGVLPRLEELFDVDLFCERFLAKGRFRDYLEPIPVRQVLRTESALVGVAQWMLDPRRRGPDQ